VAGGRAGARWRRKSGEGQLAAGEDAGDGRWAALQKNREGKQEEEDEDLYIILQKFKDFTVK
jgi:hypothetical protein